MFAESILQTRAGNTPQLRQYRTPKAYKHTPYTQQNDDQENIPPASQYNYSNIQQVYNINLMSFGPGLQLNGYTYNVDDRVPNLVCSSGSEHGQWSDQASMSPPLYQYDIKCDSEAQLNNHIYDAYTSHSSTPVTTSILEHFSDNHYGNSAMNCYVDDTTNVPHTQEEPNILDLDAHKSILQHNANLLNASTTSNYQAGSSALELSWRSPVQPIYRPYVSPSASQAMYTQAAIASQANSPARASQESVKTETGRLKDNRCSTCNKGFSSLGHLKRHYNTKVHIHALRIEGQAEPSTTSPPRSRDTDEQSPPAPHCALPAQPQPHCSEYGNNNVDIKYNTNMLDNSPRQDFHQMTTNLPPASANQVATTAYQLIGQAGHIDSSPPNMSTQPSDTVTYTLSSFNNFAVYPYNPGPAVEPTHCQQGFGQLYPQTLTPSYHNGLDFYYIDNQPIANQTTFIESSPEIANQGSDASSLENSFDQSGSSPSGYLPTFTELQTRNYNVSVQNCVDKGDRGAVEGTPAAFIYINSAQDALHNRVLEQTHDLLQASSPTASPLEQTTPSQSSPTLKCYICDKTFAKICYLTQHNISIHSGERPFKCLRCGKRFQNEMKLEQHRLKHSRDKPFKCSECPNSFNHKADLRRHVLYNHSEVRPFSCEQCNKGFVRKDQMIKHIETHFKRKKAT